MKKTILLLSLLLILLSSFVLGAAVPTNYSEDFESGTVGDWYSSQAGDTISVVSTPTLNGTYALRDDDLVSGATNAELNYSSSIDGDMTFNFIMRVSSCGLKPTISVISGVSGDITNSIFIYVQDGSNWKYYNDTTYVQIKACAINTNEHWVIVRKDNGATSTFDLYINGTQYVTDGGDRGSLAQVDFFNFAIDILGGNSYIDDFNSCTGQHSTGCPQQIITNNFSVTAISNWTGANLVNFSINITILKESYINDNNINTIPISTFVVAQTFNATENFSMSNIRLKLAKIGSPNNITVSLRATNSTGAPTGIDLVSTEFSGNGITTNTIGEWIKINLSYPLIQNTSYAILLSGSVGTNNQIRYRLNTSGGYSSGSAYSSTDSGITFNIDSTDVIFEIYSYQSLSDNGTGTIDVGLLNNDTSLYNISFSKSDRFLKTFLNYNVSTNLIASLFQSIINLSFLYSTDDYVDVPFNLTSVNNNDFFNITDGSLLVYPDAGLINFSVIQYNNIFHPFNITINVNALDNLTYNFTVNETHNIITFLDAKYIIPIINATITVTYPSSDTIEIITNSSGQINFSYINDGVMEFGDYTYYIDKPGYFNTSVSDTINESNIPHERTYNISKANLIINIYDRNTQSLITQNVTISMLGLFNETTTTGQLIKENLTISSGDYAVYASSDGYETAIRSITYTNQENLTINFYLLNTSQSNKGTVFVTTKDSLYRDITGSPVSLLEYKPGELSFVSVDECISNINAECTFSVELDTKIYYIRATAIIDSVLYVADTNEEGEIFTLDGVTRNLIFFTSTEFTLSPNTNLVYDIDESFTNNVSSISVNFFTLDGNALEVCIEYFKEVNNVWVSVTNDTYCLESSSAIQNVDTAVTLNRSNKYKAEVYIKQSYNNVLDTFIYPSNTSIGEIFNNNWKSAIVMLFWIFALGYSMHQKNITLFFVLAIILSWVELVFFPLFTMATISVFKTVLSLIGIYIARKRQDSP